MKKLLALLSIITIAVTTVAVVYIIHKDDCNKRYDCDDLIED